MSLLPVRSPIALAISIFLLSLVPAQAQDRDWVPKANKKVEDVCWSLVRKHSYLVQKQNMDETINEKVDPNKWVLKRVYETRYGISVIKQLILGDDTLVYEFINPTKHSKVDFRVQCVLIRGEIYEVWSFALGPYGVHEVGHDILCSDDRDREYENKWGWKISVDKGCYFSK